MRFNPHKLLERLNVKLQTAIGRSLGAESVEVNFLPRPRITIQGLTLSNASWSPRPHFIRFDRVVAEISLRELMRRRLVLPRMWIEGGEFSYEFGPDDQDNWMFSGTAVGGDEDLHLPVIHELFIKDIAFPVLDARDDFRFDMRFDKGKARMAGPQEEAAVNFDFDWAWQGRPPASVAVTGNITSFHALFNGKPVMFDLTARGHDLELTGQGSLHQTVIEAKAGLTGRSLENLSRPFDSDIMESLPFDVTATLGGDLSNALQLSDVDLQFDKSHAGGDITIAWSGPRLHIGGAVQLHHYASDEFGGGVGPVNDARMIPPVDLDWTALGHVDWDLRVDITEARIDTAVFTDITANLTGTNGKLHLTDMFATGYNGDWQGDAALSSRARPALYHAEIDADKVMFADFLAAIGLDVPVNGPARIIADVKMRGRDLQAWANSLTGDVEISLTNAELAHNLFDFLGGDLLRTALGRLQDRLGARRGTPVECLVSSWRFDKGVGKTRLFFIDTRRMTLYIDGEINLREERLDLVLTPKAKEAGLSLGTPIHVYGPWAKLNVVVDPTALARKAAGLALGVATVGAGLMVPLPGNVLRNLAGGSQGPIDGESVEDRAARLSADRHKNRNAADVLENGIDDAVKTTIKGMDFALKTLLGPSGRNSRGRSGKGRSDGGRSGGGGGRK